MLKPKKTNNLGIFMGILVFIAVGTRYADYVWAKNSLLTLYAPCDTSSESCFISDEENAWVDIQLQPYKKVTIRDKYAPKCLQEHSCESFTCDSLSDCSETFCDETTTEEGEWCAETAEISSDDKETASTTENE